MEELFKIRISSPYEFTDIDKIIKVAIGEWMSNRGLPGFVKVELITDRWASRYKQGGGMLMDPGTGNIRNLSEGESPKEGEVMFLVGETVEIRGCSFKVEEIQLSPDNKLVLKGQPKEKEAAEEEQEKNQEKASTV